MALQRNELQPIENLVPLAVVFHVGIDSPLRLSNLTPESIEYTVLVSAKRTLFIAGMLTPNPALGVHAIFCELIAFTPRITTPSVEATPLEGFSRQ